MPPLQQLPNFGCAWLEPRPARRSSAQCSAPQCSHARSMRPSTCCRYCGSAGSPTRTPAMRPPPWAALCLKSMAIRASGMPERAALWRVSGGSRDRAGRPRPCAGCCTCCCGGSCGGGSWMMLDHAGSRRPRHSADPHGRRARAAQGPAPGRAGAGRPGDRSRLPALEISATARHAAGRKEIPLRSPADRESARGASRSETTRGIGADGIACHTYLLPRRSRDPAAGGQGPLPSPGEPLPPW